MSEQAVGAAPSGPARRGADAAIGGILAVSLAVAHRALFGPVGAPSAAASGLDAALYDPGVTSPLLGLTVFAALLGLRRDRIRSALGRPAAVGTALLVGGLGLALLAWSHAIDAPDLVLPALVLELIGAGAWLGGRALLGAIAFPLLALAFVIQPPEMVLHAVLFPLQQATVALTSLLLDLLARPHLVAGDLIVTPGAVFQVVEGCTGLKTILGLGLAAVVYAELVGRRGLVSWLLVAATPGIGFLVNGLRVLVLVFRRIPAESLEHQLYGVAAIGVGVALLMGLEIGLSRTLFRNRAKPSPSGAREVPGSIGSIGSIGSTGSSRAAGAPGLRRRAAVAALASAAVAGFGASTAPGFARSAAPEPPNIEALPLELAGLPARGLAIDDAFLGRVRFAHRFYRAYEQPGGDRFRVFVGLEAAQDRSASGFSPKTTIPHSGWVERERLAPLPGMPAGSERFRIRYDPRQTGDRSRDEGRASAGDGAIDGESDAASDGANANALPGEQVVLIEHCRLGYAPWEVELMRSWLGLEPLARTPRAPKLVVRVELESDGDPAAAELRLRQFAQEVVDWYRNAGWIAQNTQYLPRVQMGGLSAHFSPVMLEGRRQGVESGIGSASPHDDRHRSRRRTRNGNRTEPDTERNGTEGNGEFNDFA